ncbi:hypothetical protein CONPUDRAFT_161941 [Coniophora puteana RWD-64-598 SS2]|uniref:Gfd2/YDR514C-like C-terminal domain-containing protein n=1 Tax=Coniophora puteana (strain RWD-64-598) TaxID=741705 RepID=A0A5M3N7W0_CONPW|nr:uncharacterized protein CONPUDRAFT_161941 [Coniophora puteana RWD-64-598 SS2]EIW87396.1 hypothetical protein CONPUDRAFT_161941 [Coniophora puteana RWD-64-598 SS2]
MADFTAVNPQDDWKHDLHSVYAAYIGWFQAERVQWYLRTWGHLFETFNEFLAFSWPVITVTDASTGRAHIVTQRRSIDLFLRQIRSRFGETLPDPDVAKLGSNIVRVSPLETANRILIRVSDWAAYKRVHATLPAVMLSGMRLRVRVGDMRAIRELWGKREKTFMAVDFEWSERNTSTVLEWGYATMRCGFLDLNGVWPPDPNGNYRAGHYIVSEHLDKVKNQRCPTNPHEYAFGDSQVVPKVKFPQIIETILSSLASPGSESVPNDLVLVGHGISEDLKRFEELKIGIPKNVIILDTAVLSRTALSSSTSKSETLSLPALLRVLGMDAGDRVAPHNAGNDAYLTLAAFQRLMESETPDVRPKKKGRRPRESSMSNGQSQVQAQAHAQAQAQAQMMAQMTQMAQMGSMSPMAPMPMGQMQAMQMGMPVLGMGFGGPMQMFPSPHPGQSPQPPPSSQFLSPGQGHGQSQTITEGTKRRNSQLLGVPGPGYSSRTLDGRRHSMLPDLGSGSGSGSASGHDSSRNRSSSSGNVADTRRLSYDSRGSGSGSGHGSGSGSGMGMGTGTRSGSSLDPGSSRRGHNRISSNTSQGMDEFGAMPVPAAKSRLSRVVRIEEPDDVVAMEGLSLGAKRMPGRKVREDVPVLRAGTATIVS